MDLTRAIARIFDTSAEPVGAGILVGERHILTCAHVVNDALGRGKDCLDRPPFEVEIQLDFPVAAAGQQVFARVEHWWFDEDVAGLAKVTWLRYGPSTTFQALLSRRLTEKES